MTASTVRTKVQGVKILRGLSIVIIVVQVSGFASAHARENWSGWQITRSDYVEFCNGNTVAIDLNDGSLHGSIGTCAPNLNDPPKQVKAQVPPKDLATLRAAALAVTRVGYINRACEASAGKSVGIFSGPRTLTITGAGSKTNIETLSPCVTAEGRNLMQAIEQASVPLRRYGLRRWN